MYRFSLWHTQVFYLLCNIHKGSFKANRVKYSFVKTIKISYIVIYCSHFMKKMGSIDYVLLSRIQFAANITFHILFPSITIALSWFLFFFKLRYDLTKQKKWLELYQFWVKFFALSFALGVVSGITMSFQFGSNWPGFMETVGNVAGPLLAYEVLTSFFLEATFLGIMLFGISRVPSWLHTLSSFLVAFGTTLSAFWIMVLNSWMQTPAGFEINNGIAYPTDWFEIIFNPSMIYRLVHMLLASGLTASFLIAGISAYCWLRNSKSETTMSALKASIYCAAILAPLQMISGDALGLKSLKTQPAKIAATEALWKTEKGMSLRLFAIPDTKAKKNKYEISIPKLGSIILTHKLNGEIKGLEEFPEHPPIAPLFFSFRFMFAIGGLMLLVSWFTALQIYYKKNINQIVAKILVAMTFSGLVATVLGWYVAEVGRQPYLVYGLLRTDNAATVLPNKTIIISLSAYVITYIILLIAYLKTIFYMARQSTPHEQPSNIAAMQTRSIA